MAIRKKKKKRPMTPTETADPGSSRPKPTSITSRITKSCAGGVLFLAVQARAFAPQHPYSFSLLQSSQPPSSYHYHEPWTFQEYSSASSTTSLYGIRNFFRKRFGQTGGAQQDDVFLFGLDDDIGNSTSVSEEEEDEEDEDNNNNSSIRDDNISAATTTVNEAYITPGPKTASLTFTASTTSSAVPASNGSASGTAPYNGAGAPKTTTTTASALSMGTLQPPTSTFLVQASEVLWSSMAEAAERSSSQATRPTPKVRSSKLRLRRWLPPDFDEPQKMPAKFSTDSSTKKNKVNIWNMTNQASRNQKHQSQFRDMLQDFSVYTKRDVSHIPDPRLRTLFEGILASFSVPEILRAFEILYEDYPPLRYGGRLIYNKLQSTMVESQKQRRQDISKVESETGWSKDDIDASRIAFLRMAEYDKIISGDDDEEDDDNDSTSDDNSVRPKLGQARFTLQQLIDYDLSETVVEMLGYDYFESFMQDLLYDDDELDELDEWLELNIDPKKKGKFKFAFAELMVSLQNCPLDSIEPECDPATILQEIYTRLQKEEEEEEQAGELLAEVSTTTTCAGTPTDDDPTQRYVDRYNAMVDDFFQWKERVSMDRKGRKLDVLRGCFAGADRKEIVDALRIVYVDYKPLRFAGDLIFKIMRAVVMSGMA
mmetsp:Transcript_12663/g.30700  ORF Transcript_12663/g.30700 Transcript_12663/m.30700 type:complete len:654 (-) Transcript_12663:70-2031(-)